jgi:hypothetical protein
VFGMDDWEPDEWVWRESMQGMLWVVPARVGGDWRIKREGAAVTSYLLRLAQRYQHIDGHAMLGAQRLPLFDARLDADRLRFTLIAGGRRLDFDGVVKDDVMEGRLRVTGEPIRRWRAVRA